MDILAGIIYATLYFLLFLSVLINIFGLPGNWIMLGIIFIFALLFPGQCDYGLFFWLVGLGLAVLGEIAQFMVQLAKSRQFGSSSSGTFGGMAGAIILGFLFAPFLFGIGALIGAVLGAWLGCFLFEIIKGRNGAEARKSAYGAMMGNILGTAIKIGLGIMIMALTIYQS